MKRKSIGLSAGIEHSERWLSDPPTSGPIVFRSANAFHRVLLHCMAFLISTGVAAQPLFHKRYGSIFMDYANKAIETSHGAYLVAGRSFGFGSASNAILMKLDAVGDPIWVRDYAGINADEIHDILETDSRDVLVCGGTFSQGAGGWDGFVMKLDSAGSMLWGRTYGNEFGDILYKLKAHPDGGVMALGYAQSPAVSGSQGALLMKLDQDGDVVWERYVLGGWVPQLQGWYPLDVEVLPGGDVLLTTLNSVNGWHMNLWKLSTAGQLIWSKAYSVRSQGHRLAVDPSGNIYITCLVLEGVAMSLDMAVLKLDGAGNMLWFKTYGGTYADRARDIIIASDGAPVICGMTNSFGHGDNDAFLLKIAGDGTVDWCRTYGGVWPDIPSSVQQTQDGGFLLAGESYAFGTNADSLKMYVIRTDPMGLTSCNSMEWPIIQMDGSVSDMTPMTLSNLPQQIGTINWPSNLRTFTTAPMCAVTSIDEKRDHDLNILVHPNPFDRILEISSSQGNGGMMGLRVYDLLGRVVFEDRDATTSSAKSKRVDLGHLRSGVYILEVRMEDRSTTLRIVKE